MDKEEIKKLASDIMLELDDREAEDIAEEFAMFERTFSFFADIDTEQTKIMAYPFDVAVFYMRDDEKSAAMTREEVLANAAKTSGDHVSVPKVLKR